MGLVMGDLVPAGRALDPRFLAACSPHEPGPSGRRVAAYALSIDDAGRILLCRIAPSVAPGEIWTLPGGGLEFGEPPEVAVLRELTEESGLHGEVVGLADVTDRVVTDPRAAAGCTRSASSIASGSTGGELRDEVDGSTDTCAWFTLDEASRLNLGELARRVLAAEMAVPLADAAVPPGRLTDAQHDRHRHRRAGRAWSSRSPATSSAGSGCSPTTPGRGRVERRADGSLVVDFVARRPLIGVLGIGLPVTWRSRTWNEPATCRLRFVARGRRDEGDGRHLADRRGRRTGRASRSTTTSGRGSRCSPAFVDRAFTRPIAGRTLATFKALAEALADESEPRRLDEPPAMTDRRRIWITGIGIITAIGTGRDAFRAGLRAGRSPVKRIDRFDPSPFRSQVAAQVDDFDPLAWMPPKTARQLDRFSQFGLVAGRLALDDAGLTPGVDGGGAPAADRHLPRLGARRDRLRRGAARALPREGDPPGRAEPRARGLRRGGTGQPRDRARRARADPVDRELVRVGRGRARRGDG